MPLLSDSSADGEHCERDLLLIMYDISGAQHIRNTNELLAVRKH